jgi:hypothetical protein
MKWLRSRRDERRPPTGDGAETAPQPEVHPSLALGELFSGLHPDRALHVLDLGPAVGANIAWFSNRWSCTVEVADLYRSLPAAAGGEPKETLRRALPWDDPGAAEPVDMVLAWDLFNYLDRERIRALCEALAPRCRPGAPLYAMLVTAPEMPREPGTYLLREATDGPGGERASTALLYRVDRTAQRPAPRYRPAEVDALSPGFEVDRNYLLRHGVQEYLLRRAAD